ncbi:MAG: NAD(P)H-hydrate dehydratase [Planctomycetaceae bacterium]|nr:NAD(P)H-hydrate dehydratase [Planctomycetaceae bacterium]
MNDAARRVEVAPRIPMRNPDGHKGTFGTTLVVGGATTPRIMPGAAALAGRAALRSGAGLAVLALPSSLALAGATILPEATVVPLHIDREVASTAVERCLEAAETSHAIVCGCGLGTPGGVERLVNAVSDMESRPRVIDADGLNAIASAGRDALRGPIVLTPHPGEWSRLARAVGINADPLHDERRPHAAASLARRFDAGGGSVVVVLKGARTVVSDGERWWRHEHPNPALATAGSGDVLAGTIGGLLAQFHPRAGARAIDTTRDAFDLACLGVELHAAAGRVWSEAKGDAGLLAHELADALPAGRRLIQSAND